VVLIGLHTLCSFIYDNVGVVYILMAVNLTSREVVLKGYISWEKTSECYFDDVGGSNAIR
jgi:hypothetical protein